MSGNETHNRIPTHGGTGSAMRPIKKPKSGAVSHGHSLKDPDPQCKLTVQQSKKSINTDLRIPFLAEEVGSQESGERVGGSVLDTHKKYRSSAFSERVVDASIGGSSSLTGSKSLSEQCHSASICNPSGEKQMETSRRPCATTSDHDEEEERNLKAELEKIVSRKCRNDRGNSPSSDDQSPDGSEESEASEAHRSASCSKRVSPQQSDEPNLLCDETADSIREGLNAASESLMNQDDHDSLVDEPNANVSSDTPDSRGEILFCSETDTSITEALHEAAVRRNNIQVDPAEELLHCSEDETSITEGLQEAAARLLSNLVRPSTETQIRQPMQVVAECTDFLWEPDDDDNNIFNRITSNDT